MSEVKEVHGVLVVCEHFLSSHDADSRFSRDQMHSSASGHGANSTLRWSGQSFTSTRKCKTNFSHHIQCLSNNIDIFIKT